MATQPIRIIVVGCGNRLASDAAAGLEVAALLRRTPGHICEVREIASVSPAFLAELPADAIVIFVDAVSSARRPGTIRTIRLTFGKPGSEAQPSNRDIEVSGDINLLLSAAERLPEVYLIAIEMENWDPGI